MTILAPSLASFWRQIEDAGLDPESLFRKYGLNIDAIHDPEGRIPADSVDKILSDVVSQTNDPFLGLREAQYFLPAHLGPLGFAWLASASLHDALKRLQRYSRIIKDKLIIEVNEEQEILNVDISYAPPVMPAYHRDIADLSVVVKMCRFICGEEWNPVQVHISYPEPADISYYFSYFRCPVVFNMASNGLQVDKTMAKKRVTGGNESLATLNDHMVTRYLAHQSREDIISRTRVTILDLLSEGRASEDSVAERLHLSHRQLNRKLKAEGASFRGLLRECRRELAEQYINDSTRSLTEISYLLGFSEPSSFSRAYRRWTGLSPSEARAAVLGGQAAPLL